MNTCGCCTSLYSVDPKSKSVGHIEVSGGWWYIRSVTETLQQRIDSYIKIPGRRRGARSPRQRARGAG